VHIKAAETSQREAGWFLCIAFLLRGRHAATLGSTASVASITERKIRGGDCQTEMTALNSLNVCWASIDSPRESSSYFLRTQGTACSDTSDFPYLEPAADPKSNRTIVESLVVRIAHARLVVESGLHDMLSPQPKAVSQRRRLQCE